MLRAPGLAPIRYAARNLSVGRAASVSTPWIRHGSARASTPTTPPHPQNVFAARSLFAEQRRMLCSPPPPNPPTEQKPPPPKLFEVDSASFVKEVLESVDPVIVFACSTEQKNFVAPLAQAVQATAGVRLALLDTIACADIAQQLRIENSPTMLAFIGGKCMDMSPVQGQLDQEAAAGHVQKVMLIAKTKDATMAMAEAGRLLSTGELEESLKLYMHVQTTAKDTHGGPATAGMVLCAIQLKDVEAARGLADSIRRDFPKDVEDPIVKQALNAVEFAEMGASDLNVGDLEAKVAADANDHQARHDLALALFGSSKYQEAFDHGLEIIKRERGWEAGKARELLFKFFDTLGSAHPMVVAARKRMASLMF